MLAILCGCASAVRAAAPTPLATLPQVAALTNAQASRHPHVAFEATAIYYFGPGKDMDAQDGGEAIFVRGTKPVQNGAHVVPGDRVLVEGTLEPSFLPYVLADTITLIRHGTLPAPYPATFGDLLSTNLNCRFVRVRGVIRTADLVPSTTAPNGRLELLMDGGYADVHLDTHDAGALRNLLDAEVEITGAAGRTFDSKMQQTGVRIKVSSLADIRILKREDDNPWSLPITPLGKIITAYHVNDLSRRVRVRGTITYYQPDTAVVLQSGAGSLWVSTQTGQPLQIGDVADATGFPDSEGRHLILSHAEILDTHEKAPVTPQQATWRQLAFWAQSTPGGHEYDLVSTEGRVAAEVREATQDEFVMQSGGRLFTAVYRHPSRPARVPAMLQVPLDSTIRVTGICMIMGSDPVNGEAPFDVLLRSFSDIQVVARPSILNVRNLKIVIGLLLIVVIAIGVRSWALERKLRRETAAQAYVERRRSRILESINASKPLEEIIGQITEVVSFRLQGAACWCEIDGVRLGNWPQSITSQRIVRQEITGRSGTTHGTIFAAVHSLTESSPDETAALSFGAGLATLAIETSRLHSDLVHRSEFDLLTDVHNRFSLDKELDSLIHNARQSTGLFGLIYIDLNDFKQVNDVYGHHVGDLYLQEVAERMKRQLRTGDSLGRLGGDEFAVLVADVRSRVDVDEIALRLEHCLDEPFAVQGSVVRGSASVGVALYPEDAATKDGLLSAADAAMYVAKHTRRGSQPANGQADAEMAPKDRA